MRAGHFPFMSFGTEHDTSFDLALRARDARTTAGLSFVGSVMTVFLAAHWHALVALPVLGLVLTGGSLYRLAKVAGEHDRLERRAQH